jgi:uncharacterized glyoxalase superfamily protein PhnB
VAKPSAQFELAQLACARREDAGATQISAVSDDHGWRFRRIIDPFGHEWEIGTPLSSWGPSSEYAR